LEGRWVDYHDTSNYTWRTLPNLNPRENIRKGLYRYAESFRSIDSKELGESLAVVWEGKEVEINHNNRQVKGNGWFITDTQRNRNYFGPFETQKIAKVYVEMMIG